MRFYFPIIIIDEDFRSENTSGSGIRELAAAIEKAGMDVVGYTSYASALLGGRGREQLSVAWHVAVILSGLIATNR